MITKGNYSSSSNANCNVDADDDDTSDNNTDDNGVTDLLESMPVLTLPDTQSLMERLGKQNSGWDDYEEDKKDKEIENRRSKAEAEKLGARVYHKNNKTK
jgi:hypothetical protein